MSAQAIRLVTYMSADAPAGYEALTHIWLGGDRLPIVFHASTPRKSKRLAEDHWAAEIAKRDASAAAREEGRRKAAATRALRSTAAATSEVVA